MSSLDMNYVHPLPSTYTLDDLALNTLRPCVKMFFQIKISFFFVLFVYVSSQHSIQTDKDALLEFKKSIKIDPNSVLSNWNESNEVCSFRGIYCRNGYRVRRIELVGFGLVGPLPSAISNLTALRTIDLSGNKFYGKIPEGISSLIHFRYLLLESNNLEGRIPESLSSLSNLTILILKDNKLQGEIPPSLFSNCTVLSNLDLSHNFLNGKIPENIGNCPNLWNLNLYNNRFIGEIPFSLSNASDMYNLDVGSNYLSGELPSKLVSKLTKLFYLHLSYNYMVSHDQNNNLDVFFTALTNCSMLEELMLAGMGLGGSLPDSIGQLGVNFNQMLLQENKIYGSVPSGFGNLSKLMWLNLNMNHMNGTIAPELKKLPLLEKLLLSHNAFTGEIPEEIGECVHLGRLELSYNNFSGEIPESFGKLVSLRSLYLNNNKLSGEIPSSLGKCVGLADVDLSHNRFNGHIPPDNKLSGPLTNLPNGATYSSPYPSYLFLQDNSFNESIPMSLCKRSDLVYLDFSNNRLTGNLPECLENLQQLQILMLSSNQLSGVIPSFKGLISLGELNLRDNNFVGTLPRELVNLPSLNILDVGENELSGNIPGWIGERPEYLVVLRLHKNNFTGRIPESLCKASHLHVLDVAHNNLKGPIPRCLGELNAMSNYDESMFKGFSLNNDEVLTQVMKGVYLEYKKTWDLVYNMDLSSNKLVGEIPVELTALSMLMGLNLSNNHLNGSIPNNIGNLRRKLESLDLSGNKLTGVIPPSMAYLTFLSHLNLSHNNLSGRIPTGRQLQTLTDPSIYEGNKYLCGPPLSDNCSNPEDPTTTPTTSKKKHKGVDVLNNLWLFYLDVISGFATGFWGVIGVLVLKKQWRHNLFRSAEEIFDKIYVIFVVGVAKIKRRREAA